MSVIIDGGAGVTFPDAVQQTNGVTNTGGVPRYYAARAWGAFDGTVTPCTVLAGVNIASITRVSTGIYTVTFTSPMPTANYTVTGSARDTDGPDNRAAIFTLYGAPTTNSFGVRVTIIDAASSSSAGSFTRNLSFITFAVFA